MVSAKWSREALVNLEKLDPAVRARVLAKVTWLKENFSSTRPDRLHHGLRELYKLRVGDYRVIYSTNPDYVVIEAVRHRRDVYK